MVEEVSEHLHNVLTELGIKILEAESERAAWALMAYITGRWSLVVDDGTTVRILDE